MKIWSRLRNILRPDGADTATPAGSPRGDPDEIAIYRELFKNLSQVVWVDRLDKSASVLNVGRYEQFYDRPRANLEHDPLDWMNAIHADDRGMVEAKVAGQITGDFDVRYRVVHRDGTTKWLRDRSFILRDEDSRPKYLAGVVEDITAAVLREDQLRQSHKMKAVGALSGGIAHDFNNILAIVQGNVELALLNDIPDHTHTLLASTLEATRKGATLTHRLLAYSRQQPLSPTTLDPSAVINGLQVMLRRALNKSVEIEVVSTAGLWNCDADKSELETVLLNLVLNADYAMESRGKLTIEAYNARLDADYARQHDEVVAGQYVCFAVTDTGCGMSQAELALAFEPFYSTKPAGQGSGLGLSMAFGFAKQSGGHLKLYSELGLGTTVKLYLPRAQGAVASPHGAIAERNAAPLMGKSCLIIEDNPEVRDAVALQARSLGLVAYLAHDLATASASLEAHPEIDLVLTDVVLACELSGLEIVARLQREHPYLRAACMSGYTENSIIHDGRLDDDVVLLQKPFTVEQLRDTFLDLLDQV